MGIWIEGGAMVDCKVEVGFNVERQYGGSSIEDQATMK